MTGQPENAGIVRKGLSKQPRQTAAHDEEKSSITGKKPGVRVAGLRRSADSKLRFCCL